jgi:protein-disulfide isomerase
LTEEIRRLTLPVKDRDHRHGPTTASMTLVEYGDYECSYTGQAYPIVKEIQKRLGNRLLFVFRNFPLTQIHPHSQHAAEAAEAAANKLALDAHKFSQDMSKHTYAARIHEDLLSGEQSGVEGTPTFFINGLRYDDSWDPVTLLTAIKNTTPSL